MSAVGAAQRLPLAGVPVPSGAAGSPPSLGGVQVRTLAMTPGVQAGSTLPLGGFRLPRTGSAWPYIFAGAVLGCFVPVPGGPLTGAIAGWLIHKYM